MWWLVVPGEKTWWKEERNFTGGEAAPIHSFPVRHFVFNGESSAGC